MSTNIYESEETLLEYLRRNTNNNGNITGNSFPFTRNQNNSNPIRDTSSTISGSTGISTKQFRPSDERNVNSVSRSNGNNEDSTSGLPIFAPEPRQDSSESSGSNRRSNQYAQRVGNVVSRGRINTGWREKVRQTFKPFEGIFSESTTVKDKKQSVTKGRPLNETESLRLRPHVVDALMWQSTHLDELMTATLKTHPEVMIWGTMDEEDCEVLADLIISRAKVSPRAATYVRNLANFQKRIEAIIILAPRAYQSCMLYFHYGISIF